MAFTDEQREALKAKLRVQHVRSRLSNGTTIPYVEGWHVIAEANRIFGYDCWDRKTLSPRCVWREIQRGQTVCFYTAKVRITVTAGGATIVRDGIGTGTGRAAAPEVAHEIAMKAAETDATKRALATFGNPFGLALYDKDKLQVTRSRRRASEKSSQRSASETAAPPKTFALVHHDGARLRFETAQPFIDAVLALVPTVPTLEALYAFWEANLESLSLLRAQATTADSDPLYAIIEALKTRARILARTNVEAEATANGSTELPHPSALAAPKDRRLRSKEHLAFVGKQPCLVCGRRPAHAHHIRFAQPRAMGLKVSDEFTVPLCAGHHDAVHKTGDERAWWARHGVIEPLKFAERLWAASRLGTGGEEVNGVEDESGPAPAQAPSSSTAHTAAEDGLSK
jgi:DNA recombination protein Rad52